MPDFAKMMKQASQMQKQMELTNAAMTQFHRDVAKACEPMLKTLCKFPGFVPADKKD